MEAHQITQAVPCRCGGTVKVFGPCEYAPRSHWGVYCSNNNCDKMVAGDSMEEAIERWNEEQMFFIY